MELLSAALARVDVGEPPPPDGFAKWGLGNLLHHARAGLGRRLHAHLDERNLRRASAVKTLDLYAGQFDDDLGDVARASPSPAN